MPKGGPTDEQWRQRLALYAQGLFTFGVGQTPTKNSKWYAMRILIDKCPRGKGRINLLGQPTICSCKFHDKDLTKKSSDTSNKPTCSSQTMTGVDTTVSCVPTSTISTPETQNSAVQESPDFMTTQPPPPAVLPRAAVPELSMPSDYRTRLPFGWQSNMLAADRYWVGKVMFAKKGTMVTILRNWWHPPPPPDVSSSSIPKSDQYFLRRVFLWMPRKMWKIDFICPCCKDPPQHLRSKGVYNRIRLVVDTKDYYYLAAEYMDCNNCGGTYIAWDNRMLDQLVDGVKVRFPAILTYKYACDRSVISLLRGRTLGNSPTALQHAIEELHTDEWQRRSLAYLTDCERHQAGKKSLGLSVTTYEELRPMTTVPTFQWFLATYIRDVCSRLDILKSQATSVYGSVLKIDSTKKMTKKLQGAMANTASWITSVGNEYGEILLCVLTTSEGLATLQEMADGLTKRYAAASEPAPRLLYTDRDCCKTSPGASKLQQLFRSWTLIIRLDVWHFMRRLSVACNSESHPLYGEFMGGLSRAIFEWDPDDVALLRRAKRAEICASGIANPSDDAVRKAITKDEMAKHCKRRTRGSEATTLQVEALIHAMWDSTDSLGVPLFSNCIGDVWKEEKRHIPCVQDPEDVPLYTKTGSLKKGGIMLPIYRCSRGSTSLESFHLHLNRFIPGTSANGVNFQAYLLEGLTRWNCLRAKAAVDSPASNLRTFDVALKHRLQSVSKSVLGATMDPNYIAPGKYTGELLGVDYLLAQSGIGLTTDVKDIDKEIEDGLANMDLSTDQAVVPDPVDTTLAFPAEDSDRAEESHSDDEQEAPSTEFSNYKDFASIPGWEKVNKLADALVSLQGIAVSEDDAKKIGLLYDNLLDYDKGCLQYSPRYSAPKGRFKKTKRRSSHVGTSAVARCFLTGGQPAFSPSHNRLTEAICIKLCDLTTTHRKAQGLGSPYLSRWKLIVMKYNNVRQRVLHSEIYETTRLQLVPINETTLSVWIKNKTRMEEVKNLLHGIDIPTPAPCSSTSLQAAIIRPKEPKTPAHAPIELVQPKDRVGLAKVKRPAEIHPRPVTADAGIPTSSGVPANIPIQCYPTTLAITGGPNSSCSQAVSRSTLYRHKKDQLLQGAVAPKKPRMPYTCRKCNKPCTVDNGHRQFHGFKYCPTTETAEYEVWKAACVDKLSGRKNP